MYKNKTATTVVGNGVLITATIILTTSVKTNQANGLRCWVVLLANGPMKLLKHKANPSPGRLANSTATTTILSVPC